MRLIDADALKGDYVVTSTTTNSLCNLYVSMEQIAMAPTVEPASPWHMVDERPDEHTNLWLHDERGNYHVGCISTYRGYTEYIDMAGNTLHDIDYWIPIEPPKEDA